MIRGTTPTLTFELPFSVDLIKLVYITFSQNNALVFELTNSDCELSDKTITTKLTQKQTLMFADKSNVSIQLRILTNDNTALASNIIYCNVDKILKDGEI